jgi:hypothetical protein
MTRGAHRPALGPPAGRRVLIVTAATLAMADRALASCQVWACAVDCVTFRRVSADRTEEVTICDMPISWPEPAG